MPKSFIKKVAKKEHEKVSQVEKKWERAKSIAKKAHANNKYAVATTILEKMEHYHTQKEKKW